MTDDNEQRCGGEDEVRLPGLDSRNGDDSGEYHCTEEDLSAGARFFDFDRGLVDKAMKGNKGAFETLCGHLCSKLDQIETQIKRRCPGWTTEQRDRVRDLFVHDRFLRMFTNPPKGGIKNFNALCWKFLLDSIIDTWRFFHSKNRDISATIYEGGGTGNDGEESLWNRLDPDILVNACPRRMSEAEKADLVEAALRYLRRKPSCQRRVFRMWLEGYTEKEIGARLDLTTGNVGVIVSRIVQNLREQFRG